MPTVDQLIASVAVGQGGHIHHRQLLTIGLTRKAIRHRIARGLLIVVHHHVYAVAHVPTNPLDRAHGVLLACGPRAALSHASAASLYSILPTWRTPYEVSSALDRRPKGIRVHHRPALRTTDIIIYEGLRVTTPALALLDLAPRLTPRRRVRALNELRLEHGLEIAAIEQLLGRFPRHPGTKLVTPLIHGAPAEPARSYFEDDWPPFATVQRLPPYELNQIICGYRVDVIFPPDLLIVELDGWRTHGTPASFESDREQDADILQRTGIPTLRITHTQFHADPPRQAQRIHEILNARSARSARAA